MRHLRSRIARIFFSFSDDVQSWGKSGFHFEIGLLWGINRDRRLAVTPKPLFPDVICRARGHNKQRCERDEQDNEEPTHEANFSKNTRVRARRYPHDGAPRAIVRLRQICFQAHAGWPEATPDRHGCRLQPEAPETPASRSCGDRAAGLPERPAVRQPF